MDFSGLGAGILDKIEEDWGKTTRRILTFLIALGVAALSKETGGDSE